MYKSQLIGPNSGRFPVRARTNRQTDRHTRLNVLPTPAAMPAWVIIKPDIQIVSH